MLTDWRSYQGDHGTSWFEQLPCQQWAPSDGHGNVRAVALDGWVQPPATIAGWLRVDEVDAEQPWDGLHVVVAAGNHHMLIASLARSDGVTVVSRQWGEGRYDDLARTDDGLQVDPGYTFAFEVDWPESDRLRLRVGTSWRGTVELDADIPTVATGGAMAGHDVPRLTGGLVGIRFDRLTVRGHIGASGR